MPVQPRIKVRLPRRIIPLSLIVIFCLLFFIITLKGETRTDEIVVGAIFWAFVLFFIGLVWRSVAWKVDVYYDRFVVANWIGLKRTVLFAQVARVQRKARDGNFVFINGDGHKLFEVYLICTGVHQLIDVMNEQKWPVGAKGDGRAGTRDTPASTEAIGLETGSEGVDMVLKPNGLILGVAIFFAAATAGSLYLLFTRGAFMEEHFPHPVVNWAATIFGTFLELFISVFLFCYYTRTRLFVKGNRFIHTNWLGQKEEYDIRHFSRVQVIRRKAESIDFFVGKKKVFSVGEAERGYDQLWAWLLEEAYRGNVNLM